MGKAESKHVKLNELQATAICGNDISSSCLYVSALTIIYAGQYAWISLLVVALVLYLFRKIYSEVVGALPLNGGAYNVLLNTTSKRMASVAACLTILSYMATAVISAYEAIFYLHTVINALPLIITTIALLGLFALLAIIGIGESAKVAVVIFITHICSLTLLVILCCSYVFKNGFHIFINNWHMPVNGGLIPALFFGFCAAMLGISGFESSANFVEEQKPGVFAKTLRNMWRVVSFFNPVIAFLALCIIPVGDVKSHEESLLAFIGKSTGGDWMSMLISIDAVLVLSGAVLTSYVGVSGLAERITLDRVLPNFFLAKNRRYVNYRIIIGFFILCVSILLVTKGRLVNLAGVYTFSFLTVMALFGVGNLLLKIKRKRLPRPVTAPVLSVFLAIILVVAAFMGNTELNSESFIVFIHYLVPALAFVIVMLNRARLIRGAIYLIRHISVPYKKLASNSNKTLQHILDDINSQELVFFAKGNKLYILNRVMIYIEENEATKRLKIVHIKQNDDKAANLQSDLEVLDRAYPHIKIEYVEIEGKFGPAIIEELSQKWNIPKNFMFIGSPDHKFPYRVSELGGVRMIM